MVHSKFENQLDLNNIMVNSFLGYKYRKEHKALYSKDANVPVELIKLYYSGYVNKSDFNEVKKGFINRYIKNESEMENVHEKEEIAGLQAMYEDMVSMNQNDFEMFSIMSLHRKLYSKCPYPEAGGVLRSGAVFLPGSGTDLDDYTNIFDSLLSLEDVVNDLKKLATHMKETNDYSQIFKFVEECVKLKCRLIKIHPFEDGNGRTVRCFTNKLFEIAGIPPVYIRPNEKVEYSNAVNIACNEGKYDDITGFYLYKICDSIIELDINEQFKEQKKRITEENTKKYSKNRR